MKKIVSILAFMLVLSGRVLAVDLAEIQKLKEMGFSNEQIVEMTKGQNNAAVASNSGITPENQTKLNTAKNNHKGLLVICASKEYPDRGPGYLDVFLNNGKMGQIALSEYVSNGPQAQSKTNYYEYSKKNKGTSGTSSTTIANNICSRYTDVYELPTGSYEIKLERKFYMGDPTEGLRFKSKKHKIFHNVNIEEGKVTVLSYYWEANEDFGRDVVMSGNHKQFANDIVSSWGNNILKVQEK